MKSYRLLIFDFDGTLVDTLPDIAIHANRVLKEFGCRPSSLPKVKRAIGWGVHELFMALAPDLKDCPEKLSSMVDAFRKYYAEKPVLKSRLYERLRQTLQGPLGNIPKAIVTNKPQNITVEILEHFGLTEYFKIVIGGGSGYPLKPDPSSVLFVIEKFPAKKSQTVLIGDSAVDCQTASNAGIDFVWMRRGYDASVKQKNGLIQMDRPSQWASLVGTP